MRSGHLEREILEVHLALDPNLGLALMEHMRAEQLWIRNYGWMAEMAEELVVVSTEYGFLDILGVMGQGCWLERPSLSYHLEQRRSPIASPFFQLD